MTDGHLFKGFLIHEVVQLTVVIQILHLLGVDVCLRELVTGVEGLFLDGSGQNVLMFGSDKSSALTRLDMLEIDNDMWIPIHLKGDTFSEISCCDHISVSLSIL